MGLRSGLFLDLALQGPQRACEMQHGALALLNPHDSFFACHNIGYGHLSLAATKDHNIIKETRLPGHVMTILILRYRAGAPMNQTGTMPSICTKI